MCSAVTLSKFAAATPSETCKVCICSRACDPGTGVGGVEAATALMLARNKVMALTCCSIKPSISFSCPLQVVCLLLLSPAWVTTGATGYHTLPACSLSAVRCASLAAAAAALSAGRQRGPCLSRPMTPACVPWVQQARHGCRGQAGIQPSRAPTPPLLVCCASVESGPSGKDELPSSCGSYSAAALSLLCLSSAAHLSMLPPALHLAAMVHPSTTPTLRPLCCLPPGRWRACGQSQRCLTPACSAAHCIQKAP